MGGEVSALFRYPVKGFSPEKLEFADLIAGECFPNDRMFAVENGPSGFDPAEPKHISKQKFTVLARSADVAKLNTRYDDKTGMFFIEQPGGAAGRFCLTSDDGRDDCAHFLSELFGETFAGPLRVLQGPGAHRFTDHHKGQVSLLNLASHEAFEEKLGQSLDPARFRMNIHLTGLHPFEEDAWRPGDVFRLGEARLSLLTATVRCKATHANPQTGEYDLDLVPRLFEAFGRNTMGVYFLVEQGGRIAPGDRLERV